MLSLWTSRAKQGHRRSCEASTKISPEMFSSASSGGPATTVPIAENGEIVVALLDGESTVKRLAVEEGHVELLPANPRYWPIAVSGENDFRIVGKVVGIWRRPAKKRARSGSASRSGSSRRVVRPGSTKDVAVSTVLDFSPIHFDDRKIVVGLDGRVTQELFD
jgi:hypothetical protein